MPIHVVEVRALRLAHKRGEGPGPLCHPVHGNAAKQRLARAFEQRLGFGPLVYKALLLALHERLQAAAVDCLHERSRNLSRNSGGRASSPGGLWLTCRKRVVPSLGSASPIGWSSNLARLPCDVSRSHV